MKKKLISALLCVAMVASMLVGCGDTTKEPATDNGTTEGTENTETATGKVYYLNFKPEQAEDWEALAAQYTDLTGVQVDVVTAASGTYESTLQS